MPVVLGISGSPRRGANTTIAVREALDAAAEVPGVETRFFELAGKRIRPCVGCDKCAETGYCTIKDDIHGLVEQYEAADGVIWGAPVYVMSIPANMKAAIDRMTNSGIALYARRGTALPRPIKVCGVLAVGWHRNGGEELTMSCLINACLASGNVVVSGDMGPGAYIGAACWSGMDEPPDALAAADTVLRDDIGLDCARSVGRRVAEMTLMVVAGKRAIANRLPPEYFLSRELRPL